MTITIEELRKVYEYGIEKYMEENPEGGSWHDAALLAVARFVAERQRAVEPTEEMTLAGLARYNKDAANGIGDAFEIYRAMSAVAPLVVLHHPRKRS